MKLKLVVASIGMGVVLLTGCGGGTSGPSVIEEAQQKLIGTWNDGRTQSGCQDDAVAGFSGSDKTILKIDNNDFIVEFKDYNNSTCDESGLIFHDMDTYDYDVIGTGKSAEGHDAFKIDLIKTKYTLFKGTNNDPDDYNTGSGTEIKAMFLFDGDHLVFSKKGMTRTDRTNDFNLSDYWVK